MCTMGILLVADILDEHTSLANLFDKGNPLMWGGLGWFIFLLWIAWVVYKCIKYFQIKSELKCTKAGWVSKIEGIRVELERAKLTYEETKEAYEGKKRELDKELKAKLERELELREELTIKSVKDFTSFLVRGKAVVKELDKLKEDKKELEKNESKLEEERGAEIEICLSRYKELQKEMEECKELKDKEERDLEKNRENYMEKMKKRITVSMTVLIIMFADGNNMLVTAKEFKNTLVESFGLSKESQENEPETEEAVSEEVTVENEEKNIEALHDTESALREHIDYNFILEEAQLHKVMDDDIADIIFLTGYPQNETGYEHFLTDCREGKMLEMLPEVNKDSDLGVNSLLNEIAENLEKPFLEKIDRGKIILTQIEWEQSAPTSAELEDIIEKRRQVLGMEESISVRRTTYFLLANDYQRLAKECLIQGKDDTQIYYYYGMSIYCCYCALGYESSDENLNSDEKILNYVKARYKDIIDNVKMENLTEEVDRAEKIYSLLNQ